MARVAAGDRDAALIELYRRYARRLYGLGRRLLPERGMAEELVQDTFVRLWRSASSFDERKGSAQTFIFTLARRAAVDLLRRSAARPLGTLSDLESELPDEQVSDQEFGAILLGLEVREALSALPDKHREVLELLFDDGLTQREAADRLDVPLGTIKTRCFYALRGLKTELEGRDVA